LCQLRVAPYSYDWIDNFGRQSPRELTPGLEHLEIGQRFVAAFRLVDFEEGHHLTMVLGGGSPFGTCALTYLVRPCDEEHSRLVVKMLLRLPLGPVGSLFRVVMSSARGEQILSALELVMMRKQLRTLKELAEQQTST
jgi:hypothetical protein